MLGALAAPCLAATITVTGTGDTIAVDGLVTLREAITSINNGSNVNADVVAVGAYGTADTINFNIAGAGVRTITLTSTLPAINKAVFINGYTQSGASANTNALNAGINAALRIEVNGAVGGGLLVNAAGTVIRGLNIHAVGDEIEVNADNVTIAGNFLGTNPAGSSSAGTSGSGIRLTSGNNSVFGGPAAADRNLLSPGFGNGIILTGGNGTLIQGNYIGTDVTGTVAINAGGGAGIFGVLASNNTSIFGNLISGNSSSGGGVSLNNAGTIQGNLIGTQRDGISSLPNGVGVLVFSNVLVGGTGAGQGNTIAFNITGGVFVDSNGSGDAIQGNSIYSNGTIGITLNSGVPVPNDACDVDNFPGNRGQNYPVLTSASIAAGQVTLSGTLNSNAARAYRIELFSNTVCNASGNGQGKTFLGFANVTTVACNASFGPVSFAVPAGETVFTSTATDTTTNDTSEFSACTSSAAAASANLSVTKSAPATVAAGGNISYTIAVANAGPDAAASVSLTDVLPANTTFVSLTAPGGWTTSTPSVGGTGTMTATNPTLANGGNASFTLVVNVNGGTAGGTAISNTATVASSTADPNGANNTAFASTTVAAAQADLSVTKAASATVAAGGNVAYTIAVSNTGPNAASSVSLTDAVPANTTFVSFAAPAGWTASTPAVGGTGSVTATNATLANGATATFTLVVQVTGGTANGTVITNTANVSSSTADPNPANNASTAATTVTAVIVPPPITNIPTLSGWTLLALGLLLAVLGIVAAGRKRSPA